MAHPGSLNLITDVPGLRVGNAEDAQARTGVTVLLPEAGRLVAGVDVRGAAPGTRETDSLRPEGLVSSADAIVLSGGSVYGIEAASGVCAWAGAHGRGYEVPGAPLRAPVVPTAILFDLANGGDKAWGEGPPYWRLGREAAMAADADGSRFALGNAGAGLGAVAGAYKGGLGSASAVVEGGFVVGALVAANPVGSPVMPGSSAFWAWPFEQGGEFGGQRPSGAALQGLDLPEDMKRRPPPQEGTNTTIGIVATNAILTPPEARRLAVMAQDGLARAVRPIHTGFDGDTVFAVATGRAELGELRAFDVSRLGSIAADCMARAIARAVWEAETLGPARSYREVFGL